MWNSSLAELLRSCTYERAHRADYRPRLTRSLPHISDRPMDITDHRRGRTVTLGLKYLNTGDLRVLDYGNELNINLAVRHGNCIQPVDGNVRAACSRDSVKRGRQQLAVDDDVEYTLSYAREID